MQKSYPTTLPDLRTALTQANSICIIEHVIDLNNTTIYIASNVVIRFEGGLIKDGTLFGNQVGTPTVLEVEGYNYVFDNVVLDGWWRGYCSDLFPVALSETSRHPSQMSLF